MQDNLTKPNTLLKKEDNAHIFHQQLPQQKTENSPGNSPETRGKPETIHSPTNATNKHNKYSDQGYSIPETIYLNPFPSTKHDET